MSRLPNAPEVFEGREDEKAWVRERLAASPLSIVWAPPGLGKTSLALATLRGASGTVYASALDAVSPVAFVSGLVRELDRCAARQADPSMSETDWIALLVDVAERDVRVLVLDDLHALGERSAEQVLLAFGRYGAASRVVALSRLRPRHPELAEKTLRLEPLAERVIARIVARCAPRRAAEEVARIAREAAGSPFRARRIVLGEDADGAGSLTGDLGHDARRAILALRVLSVAVPIAEPTLRALEARGLLRVVAGLARLDDRLRPMIDREPLDEPSAIREALALVTLATGEGPRIEELKLLLRAGRASDALAVLARERQGLLVAGLGPELFEVLSVSSDPAFDEHRFACADYLLGGAPLTWALTADPGERLDARLAWCRLLAHGGQLGRARDEAARLLARATGRARVEVAILLGDLHRHAGDPEQAIALLASLETDDELLAKDRDLRLAAAYANHGDVERAISLLELSRGDERLAPSAASTRVLGALGSALLAAGRFRELERVFGDEDPPSGTPGTALFVHVAIAVERGRFERAERLLRRVRPYTDTSIHLRFSQRFSTLRVRLVRGPMEGLGALAAELALDPDALELPEILAWSRAAKASVDVVLAPGARFADASQGERALTRTAGALVLAWRTILDARAGRPLPVEELALPESHSVDVAVVALRAGAERALVRGALAEATASLSRAIDLAERAGLVLEEVALAALLLDVQVLGAVDAATRSRASFAANRLRALAEELGSSRFRGEAELGAWLAAPPAERDPGVALRLAEDAGSPIARRRAIAIVRGGTSVASSDGALDSLDARIVALARGATSEDERGEAAIVLDLGARTLRLPSGARVSVGASELTLRILEVLARSHGRATKEALVLGAWDKRTYHPHKDDQRLHVAVHRLRHLLEPDPKAPSVVVREDDAYRVTVPIRLGRLEA